ncbi:MAG: Ig-like domain-containing protein, partial [Lachnospiraceae bacterium]
MGRKIKQMGIITVSLMMLCIRYVYAYDVPEKQEEQLLEGFVVTCEKPNGTKGYYCVPPKVSILHQDADRITRYQVVSGNQIKTEGSIKGVSEEVILEKEKFVEGENIISVWMENQDGVKEEKYQEIKTIYLDTKKPKIQVQSKDQLQRWQSKDISIQIKGEDGIGGSGIAHICCDVNQKRIADVEEAYTTILVKETSQKGKPILCNIQITDCAGNVTEQKEMLWIDRQAPKTDIRGAENYSITSEPAYITYRVEDENALDTMSIQTYREDVDGQITMLEPGTWKDSEGGKVLSQNLDQDGIYHMQVTAIDKAGHQSGKQAQMIVDQNNPIIGYVHELDGAYISKFQWNHSVEEMIKDFTTYTYHMELDGKLYTYGSEVDREGAHCLLVKATDAAGNQSEAQAKFVIDHTSPKIQYREVEQGKTYKEDVTARIMLEDPNDRIERISINGKPQDINLDSRAYQYTLQEPAYYVIEVIAKDRAGNVEKGSLKFQIIEPETILEKAVRPIKKALGFKSKYEVGTETKKEVKKEVEKEVEKEKEKILWYLLATV